MGAIDKSEQEVYYRFQGTIVGTIYLGSPWFYFETLPVLKRTKHGCWASEYGAKRFVLDRARKKLAYPSKELAVESFVKRKERLVRILKSRLDEANELLRAVRVIELELEKVAVHDGY